MKRVGIALIAAALLAPLGSVHAGPVILKSIKTGRGLPFYKDGTSGRLHRSWKTKIVLQGNKEDIIPILNEASAAALRWSNTKSVISEESRRRPGEVTLRVRGNDQSVNSAVQATRRAMERVK